ncbi:MAG: OmpA family protein [Hyphomicrobiaceae bacterium]
MKAPTGFGYGLFLMVAFAGAALCQPQAAHAQGREVLLGSVSTGQSALRPDQGREAADLMAEGLAALERGDVMIGRRHLEEVVARYPDTLAADSSRRDLRRYFGERHGGRRWESWRRSRTGSGAQQAKAGVTFRDGAEAHVVRTKGWSDDAGSRTQPGQSGLSVHTRKALAFDFLLAAGDRVFFGEASTTLTAKGQGVLEAQARWLLRHRELPVIIEAHSDDGGSADFNLALSQRRGEAVRNRLIAEGVSPDRIVVRARGNEQPIALCQTALCAAQNRRVQTAIGQDEVSNERGRSGELAFDKSSDFGNDWRR